MKILAFDFYILHLPFDEYLLFVFVLILLAAIKNFCKVGVFLNISKNCMR